jgi:hypothetical protein
MLKKKNIKKIIIKYKDNIFFIKKSLKNFNTKYFYFFLKKKDIKEKI